MKTDAPIAADRGDGRGGRRYWNVEVATFLQCGTESYIHYSISGPFGGFEVAEDVSRDFAAKPGVLCVQVKPSIPPESTPHTPCAVKEADPALSPEQEAGIETLLAMLAEDRSVAAYVKKHLERLGVWNRYEDRFLDLFTKRGGS